MNDPGIDVGAIFERLNAIGCELDDLAAGAATHILRRDAGRLNREYVARLEVLKAEQVELRAKLPPEGMASGQRLVMARALGSITLRDDTEPAYTGPVQVPVDAWDWSEP